MASSSGDGGHQGLEELDWTCKLQDELLFKILSCLSFKEAVRTSVLSNRWRNLWKFANLELDFDCESEEYSAMNEPRKRRELSSKHARWYFKLVNGVVKQLQQQNHNHSKVRKFRVVVSNLHNDGISSRDINRWMKFAISKRIESLELSFRKCGYVLSEYCYSHIKSPVGVSDIKSLRCLRLSCVELIDGILEHFIANCPLLEELSVTDSCTLTKLRVVGTSSSSSGSPPLPLKNLEVRDCVGLKFMEIDNAPRLSRLTYGCINEVLLRVENCPCFTDLTIVTNNPSATFRSISGYAARLESLYLETDAIFISWLPGNQWAKVDVVEYSRLERLALKVEGAGNLTIDGLIPFINACPRLHTLQLFLDTCDPAEGEIRQNVNVAKSTRASIKVVEIIGFNGYRMECDFMKYVLEYFVGLEKVVLERGLTTPYSCNGSVFDGRSRCVCTVEQGDEAKRLALKFKSVAPRALEFIVI
ncbi:F-box/FBD/LRR-repeat protein At5g53840 [Linum perenne]